MLNKIYSTLKNFFKDEEVEAFKRIKEYYKAKLDPPTHKLLTIVYEWNEEGTIAEIYTLPEEKYKLVVNNTEEYELSFYKLAKKLKEIERITKSRKILYNYSILPPCIQFSFLFYARFERIKAKKIKTLYCKNYDIYAVVRKTKKANRVHIELIVGNVLAIEGWVPAYYLKNLEKLKEFLEIPCELKEV